MAAPFITKCSACGRMGAPYQVTNEQGETQHLCHECNKPSTTSNNQPEEEQNNN